MNRQTNEVEFNISVAKEDGSTLIVDNQALFEFASFYGLPEIAPGRISMLFYLDFYMHSHFSKINAWHVVDEVKYLEGIVRSSKTKREQAFKHPPLTGLWHKHFMLSSIGSATKNIWNELGGERGVSRLVEDTLNPHIGEIFTEEMASNLAHKLTVEPFFKRFNERRVTGEWIVFAKHSEKNYYLTISSHNAGDENIANQIATICAHEFPFLRDHLPASSNGSIQKNEA